VKETGMREALEIALELYEKAKGTPDEFVAYLLMKAVACRKWGAA
jgi:hypothetical protein